MSDSFVSPRTKSVPLKQGRNDGPYPFVAEQRLQKENLPALLFSEFLACLLFVFFGGAVVSVTGDITSEGMTCHRIVLVALTDGLIFYALIYLTMKLGGGRGGYFNPCLTLALGMVDMYLDKNWCLHLARAFAHVTAQTFGAIIGALLLLATVPNVLSGLEKTGAPVPNLGESSLAAFMLSFFLSFFVVLVVLTVRSNEERKSSIIVAFAYIAVRLISFPLSFDTFNPARSFAHAVVSTKFSYLGIYFFGPCLGAACATAYILFMHTRDLA
mmetsp:Transcript_35792/g.70275  ORF Transcript_35792/g.70275 Transcript_35792/m.70275 type:complete len:271 (+) Transcript_35792:33-845(+)|eukprot:CAMPEP_0175150728 /NCGR_PEP_ID=MMETSP0087-20121206/18058_1 /TAXON_ID=136419 /ORGANISM="Unknown Unknown, Strain D1" /LENGTH=270 /DNA_ID=CAMNT_0016436759 /DNA_START=33 /DNA_END=845 /DNA_ORIENTATION=+